MGCNRVLLIQLGRRVNPSSQPGHTGFFFPCFFFNPARFQPQVPGRPAGQGRILKLWFLGLSQLLLLDKPFERVFIKIFVGLLS
jgi:hypothetical protein